MGSVATIQVGGSRCGICVVRWRIFIFVQVGTIGRGGLVEGPLVNLLE